MIKKILVILCLALASTSAFAENLDGEGRFYAKDEDSLSFIKSQLLHSAFSDVLTKELKYLGLDASQFWKSYDEKFEGYFEPIKEQLQKKYSMNDNPTAQKRKSFNKSHRLKRLALKSKYGRVDRAVTSYSIRKMTRSAQIPNSRYININAKVDRKLLKKIYFQMISDSVDRAIKTVYVSASFNINDLSWSDVGVELESDFTNVIKNHWRKWLSENLKTRFGEIKLTDASEEKELDEFLKTPKEAVIEVVLEGTEGQEEPQPSNEHKDGLWLKINIDIAKVKEDFLMKERAYRLSGDFILIDLNTTEIVHSFDLPISENKYSYEAGAPLSTNIATWVYRTASSDFGNFDRKIAAIPSQTKSVELTISGAKTFLDFEKVGEALSIKGASQRFSTKILSFEGDKGRLLLNYSGNKENLLKTLSSLGDVKIDEARTLAKANEESPFSFQVITDPVATDGNEQKTTEDKKDDEVSKKQ